MRITTMPPVAAATAGAVCISSSAVLMKLASTASPSVVAFGRCAFALPCSAPWRCASAGAAAAGRRADAVPQPLAGPPGRGVPGRRPHLVEPHDRPIGAGLGTVVGNLEVLIISLLAWLVLGERPSRSLVLASPVMLAGLVLVGGLADTGRSHAYGTDPALGVGLGVGVAVLYAVYILMLRQATRGRPGRGGGRPAVRGDGRRRGGFGGARAGPGRRAPRSALAGPRLAGCCSR